MQTPDEVAAMLRLKSLGWDQADRAGTWLHDSSALRVGGRVGALSGCWPPTPCCVPGMVRMRAAKTVNAGRMQAVGH